MDKVRKLWIVQSGAQAEETTLRPFNHIPTRYIAGSMADVYGRLLTGRNRTSPEGTASGFIRSCCDSPVGAPKPNDKTILAVFLCSMYHGGELEPTVD